MKQITFYLDLSCMAMDFGNSIEWKETLMGFLRNALFTTPWKRARLRKVVRKAQFCFPVFLKAVVTPVCWKPMLLITIFVCFFVSSMVEHGRVLGVAANLDAHSETDGRTDCAKCE